MDYQKVIEQARTCIGPYCKACAVCNGRACKNTMPGPGAKGIGDVAIRNFQKWQEIRINMDTICEKKPADTTVTLFGKEFSYPFFATFLQCNGRTYYVSPLGIFETDRLSFFTSFIRIKSGSLFPYLQ